MGYLGNYKDFEQTAAPADARPSPHLRGCYGAGDSGAWHCPFRFGSPIRPYSCGPYQARGGKLSAVFAALLLAVSGAAQAKNITAASPSLVDVKSAIASAANGDTVIVPAGTASWTTTLVITKPITLLGQTTVDYSSETANNRTIILDDVKPRNPIIHADVISGDMTVEPTVPLLQIKGFTFRGSPNTTSNSTIAAIQLSGACPAVRISDCHFDSLYQASIYTFGWIYGVMDNCLHTVTKRHQTGVMGMATYNGKKYGDGSWAEDAHWGSYKFFFMENNVVHNLVKDAGNMDAKRGARYVVRYSKLYDCAFVQTHGTEGNRDRGSRAIEFYKNICNRSGSDAPANPGGLRSGNILFHDNQYKGVALNNAFLSLVADRTIVDFEPWGLASGSNLWDQNDPHGLYASGTAATASVVGSTHGDTSFYVAGNLSAYDTGGYSVQNTRTGLGSIILSAVYNSGTNRTLITCIYNVGWSTAKVVFNAGDPFQICRVLRVLDQTGLGAGSLCSTPKPLNGAANEGSYAWNNTQANGSKVTIHSGGAPHPTFVEGRDYFNTAFAYTPYKYPHPLTNDIAPPSNLAIVP